MNFIKLKYVKAHAIREEGMWICFLYDQCLTSGRVLVESKLITTQDTFSSKNPTIKAPLADQGTKMEFHDGFAELGAEVYAAVIF